RVATTAYRAVSSIRRSFIGEIHAAASNPVTGAAIRVRHALTSKAVTGAMPVRPANSASRKLSREAPKADTTPMPVTTTPDGIGRYVTIQLDVAQMAVGAAHRLRRADAEPGSRGDSGSLRRDLRTRSAARGV